MEFCLPAVSQFRFGRSYASPCPIAFELGLLKCFMNSMSEVNRFWSIGAGPANAINTSVGSPSACCKVQSSIRSNVERRHV